MALGYAEIAIDAGVPPGVMNVVTGDAEVGRTLVEHDGIDMISFTGGTFTGRAIAEAAARRLQAVVLELGGKSPNIIFEEAARTSIGQQRRLLMASSATAANRDIAGSRIFVERTVFKEILSRLATHAECCKLGAPECASTQMGPMVSFAHRDRVAAAVERACSEGGRVVVGGKRPADQHLQAGAYYPATLITDVPNSARVCQEEIFGPVAVVLPFTNEADLIQQANASEFGLAAGIWDVGTTPGRGALLDHCAPAPSGSTRTRNCPFRCPLEASNRVGWAEERAAKACGPTWSLKASIGTRPDFRASPRTFCGTTQGMDHVCRPRLK